MSGKSGEAQTKKYLRGIPLDPITQSQTTWVVVAPANAQLGAIYDVKSGALGSGRNGKPYDQW